MIYPYSKFLLPAGYLPKLAPYTIFKYFEELREKAAAGFEYFYMVDQPEDLVVNSPIGGKILGVHGPWTHIAESTKLEDKILTWLIAGVRVAKNISDSARKTLSFAQSVGARYVVLHTIDLDPKSPEKFVKQLKKDFPKLILYLECDLKKPGLEPWVYNPVALYQKLKEPIVFDNATVDWNGENSLEEWRKLVKIANRNINKVVGHIHLNEYQEKFGKDQGIMKSPASAQLLKEIKASGYHGYFTFEVGPLQNKFDKVIAGLFFIAAITKLTTLFPIIQKLYAGKSQNNLYQSIKFSAKNLA